jgi:hypothetical protein
VYSLDGSVRVNAPREALGPPTHVVIQEGGASNEFYVHAFDSVDDANEYRVNSGGREYTAARAGRDLRACSGQSMFINEVIEIQFVGIHVGENLARRGSSVEQLGAHGDEAVEEIGVQGLEGGIVGLQRLGEAVLGDQELDEEVDPTPTAPIPS